MVEDTVGVDGGRGGVETGLHPGQGRLGHIGEGMEDGDEIAVLDHLNPGDGAGRRQVRLQEPGAVDGRPQDLGVEHPLQPDVAGEHRPARHLLPRVAAGERFAHELELRRLLDRHAGHVPLDPPALGQFGVRDAARRLGGDGDDAIGRHQLLDRSAQALGGQIQEHPPGLGAGGPKRRAEDARGQGAEGAGVPRAEVGVAHDHVDGVERHVQLVGDLLRQRGDGALAHLDLPGEAGDAAVGLDVEVGVEVGGGALPARGETGGLLQRLGGFGEEEDEQAGGLEELPAIGQRGSHRAPPLIAAPACSTACRILTWAPQRHRCGSRACTISSRLARGFFFSSAYAPRIIPGVQ